MPTLAALRQEFSRHLGGYWSGTATDGTTTSLVDDSNETPFEPGDPDEVFPGRWILFTSGDNAGTIRRIKANGYAPGNYRVAWNNALARAVQAGDTYEIHSNSPAEITRWINRALVKLTHETRSLLSLVPDGDMEAATTAAWTASNATPTKVTNRVMFGSRALRVANSGASGRVQSGTLLVVPGETYWIAAGASVAVGTASLIVWDATNGAAVKTISGTNAPYLVYSDEFTTPAGCHALAIRLQGAEANADIYWDHIQLLRVNDRRVPAPSWVTRQGLVRDVESLGLANATGVPGSLYTVKERTYLGAGLRGVIIDPTGAQNDIEFEGQIGNRLYFLRGLQPFAELMAETDTTAADTREVLLHAHIQRLSDLMRGATSAEDVSRIKDEMARLAAETGRLASLRRPRQPARLMVPR